MTKELIPAPPDVEAVGRDIVDAAFQVHAAFGPGLLESTYETCLAQELENKGRVVQRQMALPVTYKGRTIASAYRIDLLVDAKVIIEVKAVEA